MGLHVLQEVSHVEVGAGVDRVDPAVVGGRLVGVVFHGREYGRQIGVPGLP